LFRVDPFCPYDRGGLPDEGGGEARGDHRVLRTVVYGATLMRFWAVESVSKEGYAEKRAHTDRSNAFFEKPLNRFLIFAVSMADEAGLLIDFLLVGNKNVGHSFLRPAERFIAMIR